MPRNIVIFSDDTGLEGHTGHNTNVCKSVNKILDRSPGQVASDDRGSGTS